MPELLRITPRQRLGQILYTVWILTLPARVGLALYSADGDVAQPALRRRRPVRQQCHKRLPRAIQLLGRRGSPDSTGFSCQGSIKPASNPVCYHLLCANAVSTVLPRLRRLGLLMGTVARQLLTVINSASKPVVTYFNGTSPCCLHASTQQ